jgi:hypothetical protein
MHRKVGEEGRDRARMGWFLVLGWLVGERGPIFAKEAQRIEEEELLTGEEEEQEKISSLDFNYA